MQRRRPRTTMRLPAIARLLALAGVVWMVGVPRVAGASSNWDGPALTPRGGAPYILAGSASTSATGAQTTSVAPTTAARSMTTGSTSNEVAGAAAGTSATGSTASGNQGGSSANATAGQQQTAITVGNAGTTAKSATGSAGAAAKAPKGAAATSPALNLPAYAPVGVSGGQSLDGPTIMGLVLKFLVVLALLFIVLRVLKAIMPGGRTKRAGRERPMLLHSESIGDKQRVLLLDLGGKVVAVGVAGTAMTQLAVIEEADAVDTVRARYAPLADAVPGYQEGTASMPLSQSFIETLKRAGIVGQRQAGSGSTAPAATAPVAQSMRPTQRLVSALGAGTGRRTTRGDDAAQPSGQPPVEPILHEALEAMRAVRRRVEGA